jgi:HAD superfamily hydrolase (TIGR01549 family)
VIHPFFVFLHSMKYEAIIFDLGGVIINLDYQRTIHAFHLLGADDFQQLYTQASQSSVFDDYETGKISSQHFINKLLDFLPSGTTPNKVVAAWNEMILDVPIQKIELLDHLKSQLPIFLLSNTNEIHMDKVRREWKKSTSQSMESSFHQIYLSYQMGMRKPDQDIFQKVCADHDLDPSKTLFIDDSIQHIDGARSIGLCTHHLTSSAELYSVFS